MPTITGTVKCENQVAIKHMYCPPSTIRLLISSAARVVVAATADAHLQRVVGRPALVADVCPAAVGRLWRPQRSSVGSWHA